jgi:ABC-2 type transport system ATP-binding protein
MAATAIRIEGLVKTFGKHRAVDGLDLEVPTGSVFGFLGRNGAHPISLLNTGQFSTQ